MSKEDHIVKKELKTRKKSFEMYLMRGVALLNCNQNNNFLGDVATCILNSFGLNDGGVLKTLVVK